MKKHQHSPQVRSGGKSGQQISKINMHRLLGLFLDRRFDELTESLLVLLTHYERNHYLRLNDNERSLIDEIVASMLYLFIQPDFILPDKRVERFLDLHPVIADLIAMSSFRNTDAHVRILLCQPNNLVKLLILYNAYNTIRLRQDVLFEANPKLASRWYFKFLEKFNTGCANRNSRKRLREHIAHIDDRLRLVGPHCSTDAYFGATYIDHQGDRPLKAKINNLIAQAPFMPGPIQNRPDPKSIVVFSSFWTENHATYRAISPCIRALKPGYRLTLIRLGQPRKKIINENLFDAEGSCFLAGDRLEGVAAINPNDYGMAIFTDIGMTPESILLSNMQIAPIQVALHGHPVSTFGSRIDYWISGVETETAEGASDHYSERLVLVPGAGLLPVQPDFVPQHPVVPDSPITINCPWAAQKINSSQLDRLKAIMEAAQRPVKFRFFPGHAVQTGMVPFCRTLTEALGAAKVEVHPNVSYGEYLKNLESAHFAIDSIPFGGYNTVVDALFLGIPMVAWRGDHFYNRDAAFLLDRVGMSELVADSVEAYVEKIIRLIKEDDYRQGLRRRLRQQDIRSLLFGHEEAPFFRKAIDYLIANQESLAADNKREPIIIS